MHDRTRHLILSAMFTAAGVILPVSFHAVGLGSAFLPMFWPVAIAGFFLPVPAAFLTGILTPIISFVLTGMPPPPMLYRMIFELALLSGSVSLFSKQSGIFLTLVLGLLVSLLTGFACALLIAPLLGLPPAFYAVGSLLRGLPGIATMLIIVPFIARRLHKSVSIPGRSHGNA